MINNTFIEKNKIQTIILANSENIIAPSSTIIKIYNQTRNVIQHKKRKLIFSAIRFYCENLKEDTVIKCNNELEVLFNKKPILRLKHLAKKPKNSTLSSHYGILKQL